jgi:hypothetical protein
MTSILSVGVRWCARAIFYSGEVNLWGFIMLSFESGLVPGNVWRLTHNVVALSACRSPTVRMLASASATAVATV